MSTHPAAVCHRTGLPVGARRRTRVAVAALAAVVTAVALVATVVGPATAVPRTPRNFTGYGFDQCLAPTQSAMDAWLNHSPFWAVGIYISGDSRACRSQPNLTPTWISTQLRNGWRLLPITLGPQAACNPRFPRYSDDVLVDDSPNRNYRRARRQGRAEASDAVSVAQRLGIRSGSTLWYDMEAYDVDNTSCRESALHFTSGWTKRLHALDYVSGVYSSAASHIAAMDNARVNRPSAFHLPDRIWIARWDGVPNTSTSYIRPDGWLPGGRMKQYEGGHPETHGGVTIEIDSNWLDLGRGSKARPERAHCGGVRLSFKRYPPLGADDTGLRATALQCLLTQQGFYSGPLNGVMTEATRDGVRAYRAHVGMRATARVTTAVWTSLHAQGSDRVTKYGGAGERIRELQRALNARSGERLAMTGTFEDTTTAAVRRYQSRRGLPVTGVVTARVWDELQSGRG